MNQDKNTARAPLPLPGGSMPPTSAVLVWLSVF